MLSQMELLKKAALVVNDLVTGGGYLNTEQAREFIRLAIKESVMMKQITVRPLKSHTAELTHIGFGSLVLHAGAEGTGVAEGSKAVPDLEKVTIDTHKFMGEVNFTDEALEDNIEGGRLAATIKEELSRAVGRDMDDLVINSDTALGWGDDYGQFDGMIKAATSNVYVGGGVPLTKTVLRAMLKLMPTEYRKNRARLGYFTGDSAEVDYSDAIADRATAVGDKALEQWAQMAYRGINVNPVPLFPEDLGGANDETVSLLLDPKNAIAGIWRQIKLEQDRDVQNQLTIFVVSVRFGFNYTKEDAVVKATGIQLLTP